MNPPPKRQYCLGYDTTPEISWEIVKPLPKKKNNENNSRHFGFKIPKYHSHGITDEEAGCKVVFLVQNFERHVGRE